MHSPKEDSAMNPYPNFLFSNVLIHVRSSRWTKEKKANPPSQTCILEQLLLLRKLPRACKPHYFSRYLSCSTCAQNGRVIYQKQINSIITSHQIGYKISADQSSWHIRHVWDINYRPSLFATLATKVQTRPKVNQSSDSEVSCCHFFHVQPQEIKYLRGWPSDLELIMGECVLNWW